MAYFKNVFLYVFFSLITSLLRVRLFTGKCFRKTTFQTFLYLFAIRRVGQRKTLSSQRKIWFGFQESVFLLFWAKNTFRKL